MYRDACRRYLRKLSENIIRKVDFRYKKMNTISLTTLGRIAIGIALGGAGGLYGIRWSIQAKIRESPSYQQAMEYFNQNTNAVETLGAPVKAKGVEVGDNNCYGRKDNVIWVNVPLKGLKRSGHLHYWATATGPEANEFRVSRIELEINGPVTKRILLKDEPVEPTNETLAM